ncbi:hypothetical protein [Magnetospirillum sp. SS-4]|uniref:hypothetical protein n=1 Tax=Magnetospirillum sp. SS-4 TaxID=2681465 RepID=UPI001380CCD3|nr:hypothetical protein [Magnetospirillum sp. SS-4]CAA7612500.1 hypothetical protein MTBSS4_10165 [Magnetospirillum sp. SS-4]
MPNIFELGERSAGDIRDHDELDYRATEARAVTDDPRQAYVPRLRIQSTDALLEIGPGRKP